MPIIPAQSELRRLTGRPLEFAWAYRFPLLILLVGASADCATTYNNLALYGPGVETHVVQRWVSLAVGVRAGVPLAKLIQLAFVIGVAAWWKRWTALLLTLCGLLYAAAAVSNFFLLL